MGIKYDNYNSIITENITMIINYFSTFEYTKLALRVTKTFEFVNLYTDKKLYIY